MKTATIAALALVCGASIPAHAETCIVSHCGVRDGYHGKRAAFTSDRAAEEAARAQGATNGDDREGEEVRAVT